MADIPEYQEVSGRSRFREWFNRLNSEEARKVTTALYRVGLGNFSNKALEPILQFVGAMTRSLITIEN
jgi:putative component of toxin-antitoxin plasmid stabilization module